MLVVAVAALIAFAPPQDPPPPAPPPRADSGAALRVFLDCGFCDADYLRTEITFVDYVRDRADAQVHVLVTHQHTGSGGSEYTLAFLGLRELAGHGDTLRVATPTTATDDEERRAIARTLRLGLVRFVAHTPQAEHIEIRYTAPALAPAPAQARDRWNFWVFEIGASGAAEGEQDSRNYSIGLNGELNRVTESSRISIDLNGNTDHERVTVSYDSTTATDTITVTRHITTTRRSYEAEGLLVRGLGPHWSAGTWFDVRRDSYVNLDLRSTTVAAIEYSIFPYRESTRRLLQLRWGIGPEISRYRETTIYGLRRESRVIHMAEAEYRVTQPWGQVSIESNFRQYLHDHRKLNLETWGEVEIRLVRGLSLELWGNYEIVRDQLYLPVGELTPEEVLAERRQRQTGFSYEGGIGISFEFGAVYNNVVNPRFGN